MAMRSRDSSHGNFYRVRESEFWFFTLHDNNEPANWQKGIG
jgi:hypothetical protein